MTPAERDVIEAALAAVHTEKSGKVMVADLVHDVDKVAALVRAVVLLERERAAGSYWR